MPCLTNGRFVLDNQTTDFVELWWAEPMIRRQLDRRQPELGVLSVSANVDVQRLVAVETVEEEPVRPWNTCDRRQSTRLHQARSLSRGSFCADRDRIVGQLLFFFIEPVRLTDCGSPAAAAPRAFYTPEQCSARDSHKCFAADFARYDVHGLVWAPLFHPQRMDFQFRIANSA
jgi:hypothetical protein